MEIWNPGKKTHEQTISKSAGNGLSWSFDGRYLIVSGESIQTVDLASGNVVSTCDDSQNFWLKASHIKSATSGVVVGTQRDKLRIWDGASGKPLYESSCYGEHASAAISPDGRILAWNHRFLDMTTFNEFEWSPLFRKKVFAAVAWHPDNVRVAYSNVYSSSIDVVKVKEWQPLGSMKGHTPYITTNTCSQLEFSPDGHRLASGGGDGILRIWDVENLSSIGVWLEFSDGEYVAISRDGHFRGSANVVGHLVYVVQTEAGQATLTPDEFSQKYGWKNDPDRVRFEVNAGTDTPTKPQDTTSPDVSSANVDDRDTPASNEAAATTPKGSETSIQDSDTPPDPIQVADARPLGKSKGSSPGIRVG